MHLSIYPPRSEDKPDHRIVDSMRSTWKSSRYSFSISKKPKSWQFFQKFWRDSYVLVIVIRMIRACLKFGPLKSPGESTIIVSAINTLNTYQYISLPATFFGGMQVCIIFRQPFPLRQVDDKPWAFSEDLQKRRGVNDKELEQCVFSFWETISTCEHRTHPQLIGKSRGIFWGLA